MSLNLLTLPLSGRQIIEASAGTGKTFTLAALYVRLVLGHGRAAKGLQPANILVMTFTDAATAELRERIRLRLHQAALWFDAQVAGRTSKPDPFLLDLTEAFTPDQWPKCAAQLHLAAQSMDEAAIYTIHGWSRRMLSSFALHSRDLFEQTHLDNPSELLHQLVNDHWRRWFYPLDLPQQKILQTLLGGDPQALLKDLKTRWQSLDRQPQPKDAAVPLAPAQVLATHGEWLNTEQALVVTAKQACKTALDKGLAGTLIAAQAAKKMKGTSAKNFANWVNELQAWSQPDAAIRSETLQRFTLNSLQNKGWPEAGEHPVFAHIEALCQHQATEPASKDRLLDHAAHEVRQQYQQTKLQLSVFDFQDLLQRLHTALHADEGQMASAIRDQYPVAMVDEFQDTDPWQYQSLDRIYPHSQVGDAHALVMIGDPKQAIYSFRGADLRTYLAARTQALELNPHALHSLDSNFRSAPSLVAAVNHVFDGIEQPFYSNLGEIEFTPVTSRSDAKPFVNTQGLELPPLTVWHLPPPENAKFWSVPLQLHHLSHGFAAQIVALLRQQPEVQPRDMAVLVRTHLQAKAMQKALQKLGLPSVFMSDHANVFQSEEAQDLWRVLRAIGSPRQTTWLRSAVACRVWGLDMAQLQAFLQDDAMTDALAESCQRWLQQWQQQGVLPMLYSWLHEQHIATRLLALPDGERRLTNLLHLGELLQNASQGLQGPAALLQHLADRLQSSSDSPEAQKMRLETDDQCVQIVTFHKSKGLEYPLVFVPFLGSFKTPPKEDAKEAAEAEDEEGQEPDITESNVDEDMRLLYVALTRAKRALWLGVASSRESLAGEKGKDLRLSAVSRLLKRESHTDLAERLQSLWGSCQHIAIQTLPSPNGEPYQAPRRTALPQSALLPQRQTHQLWWTASFSSLTRGLEAGTPHEEALLDADTDADMDAPSAVPTPVPFSSPATVSAWQHFPAGARYGTLLHDLLQYQAEQAWPLAHSGVKGQDMAWQQLLQRKADWLQLPSDAQALLQPWLQAIVSTPLPLQAADAPTQSLASHLVLQTLPANALWAEMEFSLPVGQLGSTELDAHIQRHVLPGLERPSLQNNVLQGMLSGFMDLVLQHDGRYWVLDYKSNLLTDYQEPQLSAAILAKRYEVQYVLYTLALHRLLKSRLPNYDYEQHMGGAVYLFLRGVDTPSAGVHALRPPWALIDLLDQRFAKALP